MAVCPSAVKKDKIFMRYIFSENFLNKTVVCESASAGFCAPVGLAELCYSCFLFMSWGGSNAVHSLSSLVGVAIGTILVQFILHPCNVFGCHCCSTSTGDKMLRFTESDLSQYKSKIASSSVKAKEKNQNNLASWFVCVDFHLWWFMLTNNCL